MTLPLRPTALHRLLRASVLAGILCAAAEAARVPVVAPTGPRPGAQATQARAAADPDPDGIDELCRLRQLAAEVEESLVDLRGRAFDRSPRVVCMGSEALTRMARDASARVQGFEPRRELAAKMLGMIPGDLDLETMLGELQGEQLPAHYDEASNTLYILGELGDNMGRMVLAGELSSVLHRQIYGLRHVAQGLRRDGDAHLALRALVEGAEAALTVLWMQQNPENINVGELLQLQRALSTGVLESAPPYVWKPFVALSARGDTFLRRTGRPTPLAGPTRISDIDQAFDSPPRSTEQILHPVKYWKRDRIDEPWRVEVDASGLPAGWSVAHEDTLGELYLSILTEPFEERRGMTDSVFDLPKLSYTSDAAAGWGGDRYVLLEREGARILRLFTVWDTERDAAEFASALRGLEPGMERALQGVHSEFSGARGVRVERVDPLRVNLTVWLGVSRTEALTAAGRLVCSESR